jgi:hypothetical protein
VVTNYLSVEREERVPGTEAKRKIVGVVPMTAQTNGATSAVTTVMSPEDHGALMNLVKISASTRRTGTSGLRNLRRPVLMILTSLGATSGKPRKLAATKAEAEKPAVMKAEEEKPVVMRASPERPAVMKAEEEKPAVMRAKPEKPAVMKAEQKKPAVMRAKPEKPAVMKARANPTEDSEDGLRVSMKPAQLVLKRVVILPRLNPNLAQALALLAALLTSLGSKLTSSKSRSRKITASTKPNLVKTLILRPRPRPANQDGQSLRDPDLPRKPKNLSPMKASPKVNLTPTPKVDLNPILKANLDPSLRVNLNPDLTDPDPPEKDQRNLEATKVTETPDLMTQMSVLINQERSVLMNPEVSVLMNPEVSVLMNPEDTQETEDLTVNPMNGVANQDPRDPAAILMNGAEEDLTTNRVTKAEEASATAKNMGSGPASGPTKVGEGERKVGLVVVKKVVGATKTGPKKVAAVKVIRLMRTGAPIP